MIYLKVYLTILKISLLSFGGVYSIWALMDKEIVSDCTTPPPVGAVTLCRGEFNAILAISEILPGPQVNAVSMLAYRDWGIPGMAAILTALITPGLLLIPFAVRGYARFKDAKPFHIFFAGATLATISVLISFILKLGSGLMKEGGATALIISLHMAAAFWFSYRFKVSPFIIVLSAGTLGYFFL